MSSRSFQLTAAAALAAWMALSSQALAQSDDSDPEMRIQRLENQLRQLTGQNEELQFRNRQLEERLRQVGGTPPGSATPQPSQPSVAVAPPMQTAPSYGQPPGRTGQVQGGYVQSPQPGYEQPQQPGYGQPVAQDAPPAGPSGRRRGDAFDPSQNPNAPGAPQALGGGQLPVVSNAAGPRAAGQPLDLNSAGTRYPQSGAGYPQGGASYPQAAYPQGGASAPYQGNSNAAPGALATLPPTNSPRDEYDLGIGYMQRKDYALAEQTMRNFAEKYPGDPLLGDSQYWLGESLFQRQQYRDAAEVFLNVTSKYDKSAKAPDSLLRLGQSLAALKEKEAACAAFGEVARKYPRASASVKSGVDREQKRVKC
jgi:tol-pal system protein YbgF